MENEQIVFVDEQGNPTGEVGPKLASHTANTNRHLAFSCYIFDPKTKKFLLTQRARSKKVWPNVWTNSLCGHPMPGEKIVAAMRRRADFELGLSDLQNITCILADYKYTTPPYNGIIENEFCPVHVAFTNEEPTPNPNEVESYRWLTWEEYGLFLADQADEMSYWSKDQYPLIVDKINELLK